MFDFPHNFNGPPAGHGRAGPGRTSHEGVRLSKISVKVRRFCLKKIPEKLFEKRGQKNP